MARIHLKPKAVMLSLLFLQKKLVDTMEWVSQEERDIVIDWPVPTAPGGAVSRLMGCDTFQSGVRGEVEGFIAVHKVGLSLRRGRKRAGGTSKTKRAK
ncbi:MAG: hypothetical protein ACM3JH_07235 [Acidithiobacillales bacterium]